MVGLFTAFCNKFLGFFLSPDNISHVDYLIIYDGDFILGSSYMPYQFCHRKRILTVLTPLL